MNKQKKVWLADEQIRFNRSIEKKHLELESEIKHLKNKLKTSQIIKDDIKEHLEKKINKNTSNFLEKELEDLSLKVERKIYAKVKKELQEEILKGNEFLIGRVNESIDAMNELTETCNRFSCRLVCLEETLDDNVKDFNKKQYEEYVEKVLKFEKNPDKFEKWKVRKR